MPEINLDSLIASFFDFVPRDSLTNFGSAGLLIK